MTDGCVHLLYNSSWKLHHLAAVQLCLGNRYGTAGRPVHHIQNHSCRNILLQPARRAAVLGKPSSLRLIDLHHQKVKIAPGLDCGVNFSFSEKLKFNEKD